MIPDAETIKAAEEMLTKITVVELVIIGLVVVAVIFLIKNLNVIIDGRVKKYKEENQHLELETNSLVKNIGTTIKVFEGSLIELTQKVAQLSENEKRHQMLTKDILKLIIYNPLLEPSYRMEACWEYFYLGGNGLTKEYALKEIILPNRKLWEVIVQKKREATPDFDAKKIYEATMDEIDKALF